MTLKCDGKILTTCQRILNPPQNRPATAVFGDHSRNIVKFCSLRRWTAEFLALSQRNSESVENKISAWQ